MSPLVFVTRPKLLSGETERLLTQSGYAVISEPLLNIIPTTTPRPVLNKKPALMVTSQASFHILAARGDAFDDMWDWPCHCVGEVTAQTATHFGFRNIQSIAQDGAITSGYDERSLYP